MSTTSIDADNANDCFCVVCDKCLGSELSFGNLELSHPNPTLFVTSQWRCPPVVYAVYRGVVALYFVSWIVLSGVWTYEWAASDSDRIKWFIYLTNWSFLVLTLDVLLQAVLVAVAVAYDKKGECLRLMPTGTTVHPVDWNTHCVNAAYVLVDTFITAIPLRLLHFYYGVTFGVIYCIFRLA
ncbi:hypothetical protein NP493_493g02005 [Ridgeia piscesae]|uniref:Uncharacterized protein n=1 Tax=Ridgeia piscesae TaxID=27915 RepID=A0AAD9KXI4_RIDPI|nr:hypothetical protein NP493_493g02005 [Ridgeia piscesae]